MGGNQIMKSYKELTQISETLTPSELVRIFDFDEVIDIVCDILNDGEWDEDLQLYGTRALRKLREEHSNKWNSNWKYDALLGYASNIILDYDERYLAFKRAFEKISPPPPQLLVAMARCCLAPGAPVITKEESIELIKQALKTTLYVEGVELLKGLYKSMGNTKEQKYWENILEEIRENGAHLPSLSKI